MKLSPMILNAITTADNTAVDVIRVGMVVSGVALIVLAAVDVIVNKQPFNALDLGGGLACVFGGGGFGLAAKSKDETAATPD